MATAQVKFEGDRRWWTARAADDRFTILTRQADFRPRGEVFYTIIDAEQGVRGPCNLIGQGWDFHPETLDEDAARLLNALNLNRRREEWAAAHPEARTPIEGVQGWRIDYPPELDEDVAIEVSHRNRVPVQIVATR